MKHIPIILLAVLVGCSTPKKTSLTAIANPQQLYTVYKIDSVWNWYVIYARKKDAMFKIVSKKIDTSSCVRIQVGKEYHLDLQSWRSDVMIGEIRIPKHVPHVDCFSFDEKTAICLEDSIRDLHLAKNLAGLCLSQ